MKINKVANLDNPDQFRDGHPVHGQLGQPRMTLTNQQQAALYHARKQRRMKAAKLTVSDTLTVSKAAPNGTLVGTLAMTPRIGAYTYEMTDNDGGKFALDGARIEVASSLSGLTAPTTRTVTIEVTDSSRNKFTETFTINVTA